MYNKQKSKFCLRHNGKERKIHMKDNNFTALNIKIRNVLLDIIQYTYAGKVDEHLYERYRKFYLICDSKQVKTYAGQYDFRDKSITIVGLTRNPKHIVVTTIHELSHHIDYCNRGTSDHSTEFYKEYEKMLHTALNMCVFQPEDVTSIEDVTDGRKVAKMIANWQPKYISYKNNEKTIKVFNCYEQKDKLKERDYHWQSADKSWEKVIDAGLVENEISYLKTFIKEENIKISDACELEIKISGYIIAGKGSYEHKENLKAEGFFYDNKKKTWKKSVSENMKEAIKDLRGRYPSIEFLYTVGK